MYVDSHCHLSFPELHQRLGAVLEDMRAAEVGGALCICTAMDEFERVHALALAHDNLWASVGVHPETEPGPGGEPEFKKLTYPRFRADKDSATRRYRSDTVTEFLFYVRKG